MENENESIVTGKRSVIASEQGREVVKGEVLRATREGLPLGNALGWWIYSLHWLWLWFHWCINMSKFIRLHTINMYSLSYVNYISVKLGKGF